LTSRGVLKGNRSSGCLSVCRAVVQFAQLESGRQIQPNEAQLTPERPAARERQRSIGWKTQPPATIASHFDLNWTFSQLL